MKNTLKGLELISPLKNLKKDKWRNDRDWINSFRKNAESEYSTLGLPGTDKEEWKYTDLSPILKYKYIFPDDTGSSDKIYENIKKLIPEKFSPLYMIFVNGSFIPELSDTAKKPEGLKIESIQKELNSENTELKNFLESFSHAGGKDSIAALNNSYLNDGAFIWIEKNKNIQFPLHLIYITTDNKEAVINSPRNIIVAEENSKISVIEEYIGISNSKYFTNTCTEILLKKGATLDHYKIQQESRSAFHIGTLEVQQEEKTKFISQIISFGGEISRNNISSTMNGKESESILESIYFAKDNQHIDNHTSVFHKYPDCKSAENYHGILDHESKAVFDGKIYVGKGAVKTDSVQSNRSLLLSENATVDSKPTLEIYADDVKCSHSAAIGQLDEDSIYYMKTRGIGSRDAKKILTTGFAKEITDRFKLRDVALKVEKILINELKGS